MSMVIPVPLQCAWLKYINTLRFITFAVNTFIYQTR